MTAPTVGAGQPPPAPAASDAPRGVAAAAGVGRWVILLVAAIYFIGPLLAAISFTLQDPHGGVSFSAYKQIFKADATARSASAPRWCTRSRSPWSRS